MLDPHLSARLERLRLQPRRARAGPRRGERLAARRGISIEFADFRHYAAGDDLRHLDWKILARLDRPVVKTYRDEAELPVHLLLDASASMALGAPSRWELARTLAAALGYVALCGGDALYPAALTASPGTGSIALRGPRRAARLFDWLGRRETAAGGLAEGVDRFARSPAPRGLALLLTDGLDRGFPDALRRLLRSGQEVVLVQILCPEELEPALEGDLRLLDAETGQALDLTATAAALREYRRRLDAFCAGLDTLCRHAGARSLRVRSDATVEDVVFRHLRRLGVVGLP